MSVPENGGSLSGLPATFVCEVTSSFEPVLINWLIDGNELSSNFVTEFLGADVTLSGLVNENLTFISFLEPQPPSLHVSCISPAFPGLFFANFTLCKSALHYTISVWELLNKLTCIGIVFLMNI